ncbi:hypothetical protein [Sinanaerobacter sp. ZZT-01]|uniref:hypothetical protein n=1 Tax=Sinanaerobacter sp. ZZT-01 TaxID=3111540 RepID=UPI002D79CDA0|nr:hypothetical protein [Sinanaerobacter sp. ZZT-01]WRR94715.1 hypothetical protein U5921_06275 [Sinanaerobacter sp. ZZT-01]
MINIMNYLRNLCEEKQQAAQKIASNDRVYHWRQNFSMNTEYDKGLKDGIELGLHQGIKQGAEKASLQLREEMAEKLIQFGLNKNEVCSLTGVSLTSASGH